MQREFDGAYPGATYAVVKGNHIYLGTLGNKENLRNFFMLLSNKKTLCL